MDFIEINEQSQIQQFSALLDRSFLVPKGMHYLDDFPIWSSDLPEIIRFGAFNPVGNPEGKKEGEEAGQLVASAGVRCVWIRDADGKRVSAALVGAVATDEKYRGQGLASRLVTQSLERARDQGAAVALLWGAEHSLYGKLGFSLCGSQVLVPLRALSQSWTGSKTSEPSIQQGWNPRIFDLLMRRKNGVILTPQDRTWFEAHRHVHWYWTGPVKSPNAFAAVGRGIDLTDLVHEWGGKPASLRTLFDLLVKERPQSDLRLLGSASGIAELGVGSAAEVLKLKGVRQEYLFLAKVLKPEVFLNGALTAELTAEELGARCFGAPGQAGERELWIWGLDAV